MARFPGVADRIFNDLARYSLGETTAASLSLHGGRIFLAVALTANKQDIPTVQACCRWLTDTSARKYARMTEDMHAQLIEDAKRAKIDPTLWKYVRDEIYLDDDASIAALNNELSGIRAPSSRRSGALSPRSSAGDDATGQLDIDNDLVADDEADEDEDDETPVTPGSLVAKNDAVVGLTVAVPFYHHTHGETHFRGEISAVRKSTYSVRFPEVGGTWSRPWTVQPNRLFHVAGA